MKIVLEEQDAQTVLLSDVVLGKTYIYTGNAGGIWVLSKLGRYHCKGIQDHDTLGRGEYHYGFVRVDKTEDVPVFTAKYDRDSVEKALKSGRKVMEFNSFGDFMRWKLKADQ